MTIAYITAHTPFGRGETFILEELLALAELGADLVIVPRNPPKEIFHAEASRLLSVTARVPLLDRRIVLNFLGILFREPLLGRLLREIAKHSRSLLVLIKNLIVVPKSVFVAGLLKEKRVKHIHAHWGSTTSTMAWIISELLGVPWSLTVHRWDISENNMLELKIDRSTFTRCISEGGRRAVLDIVGNKMQNKIHVLHTGVKCILEPPIGHHYSSPVFTIACPANLVPKKGHQFLVEACRLLCERGNDRFRCLIIGQGPLLSKIGQQVNHAGLRDHVVFTGQLPHNVLIDLYRRGEVNAVVLPSITTFKGEKEGIPVALMEAMSFGIPVVSTDTGEISELLSDGAGTLVAEKDALQIAVVLERLIEDKNLVEMLSKKGYQRVITEFNLAGIVQKLYTMIINA